ncbi:MAG: hypothetical protein ACM3JI_02775 [Anaerolineae bacterium]
MTRLYQITIKILFFAMAFWGVERFCHHQTAGFSISKISSSFFPDHQFPDLFFSKKQTQVEKILAQPFSYLGKGAQAFAFLSQDGEVVIKVLRQDHVRAPFWVDIGNVLPFFKTDAREKKMQKEARHQRLMTSYQIAFDKLCSETGLIYLHLSSNSELKNTLTLVDRLGIAHSIDPNTLQFALQKKAILVYPQIEAWMREGRLQDAKKGISSLIDFFKGRFKKGIFDKDPDLSTNFGFVDLQPIQIDLGRFRMIDKKNESLNEREEMIKIFASFQGWLDLHHPTLRAHLQEELAALP